MSSKTDGPKNPTPGHVYRWKILNQNLIDDIIFIIILNAH